MIFATADNGQLESYAKLTRASKERYCETFGYKFEPWTQLYARENPYWNQVICMMSSLHHCAPCEYLNYTGADSFILPNAGPCEYLLDENYDLIISKDKNGLNNNGFMLRNTEWGRVFLEKVWALRSDSPYTVYDNGDGLVAPRHGEGRTWFEQAAFIMVLREIGLGRVKFVEQRLINAYPKELYPECEDGDFIIHLPGLSTEVRTEYIQRVLSPVFSHVHSSATETVHAKGSGGGD